MPKSAKLSLLAISVASLVALFLGVNWHGVHAAGDNNGQTDAYRQINVYGEVLQHIQNDYVEVPNIPQVTRGAMRGLLESLDADSSYLTAKDYASYKDAKTGRAQVGINVSKRFGYATVVSVVPGSPADKANLDDGDIIEAIESKDTRDLSLATIQQMLEGQPGSELKLAVLRPQSAKPDPVKMNRVVVQQPPVAETMFEDSTIESLKPMTIDREHVAAVEAKLKSAAKQPGKKVLLDLRDVSTGSMDEGLRLANFFVGSGTLATLEGQTVAKQTFTADATKVIDTKSPLVVLVNRGTAGPAELVAAAIAGNKRGDLVGERTFGEGAQTKTFVLPDGSALILSVAKYAAPDGKKFEDDGVTPATLVASTFADDLDVSGAAAAIPTGSNVKDKKPVTAPAPTPAKQDDQLNKGLEMLKSRN
jgi:carboxyl-terminal processing protease